MKIWLYILNCRMEDGDRVKDGIKDNLFLKGMNYIFSFYFFLKSTELC